MYRRKQKNKYKNKTKLTQVWPRLTQTWFVIRLSMVFKYRKKWSIIREQLTGWQWIIRQVIRNNKASRIEFWATPASALAYFEYWSFWTIHYFLLLKKSVKTFKRLSAMPPYFSLKRGFRCHTLWKTYQEIPLLLLSHHQVTCRFNV